MPGHGDYALWVAVGEPRPYVEREWVPLGGNLVEERPKCICGPSNTPLVNCPVHGATCTACGEVWDDAHRKDWRCPKEQVKA